MSYEERGNLKKMKMVKRVVVKGYDVSGSFENMKGFCDSGSYAQKRKGLSVECR